MKNKTDFCVAIALLILCAVAGHQIWLLPAHNAMDFFSPASFPAGVTAMLGLSATLLAIKSVVGTTGAALWPERSVLIRIMLMILIIIAYITLFIQLGEYAYASLWPEGSAFSIATGTFLICSLLLTGYRRPLRIGLIALVATVFLYVVFALCFKVPLP